MVGDLLALSVKGYVCKGGHPYFFNGGVKFCRVEKGDFIWRGASLKLLQIRIGSFLSTDCRGGTVTGIDNGLGGER